MVEQAHVEETDEGSVVKTDGWYVTHTSELRWRTNERFGDLCEFEGDASFPEVGVNLRVLQPGQPASLYHAENAQEDFLVLSGECTALLEGQEISLRVGHYVHCPEWTKHVFVGAGDAPCVLLMIGARPEKRELHYPVDELAASHGASVDEETDDPREAYGEVPLFVEPKRAPWTL